MFESFETPETPEEFTFKADPADLCNRLGSLVMAAAHTLALGIPKEDAVDIIEDTIIALVESLLADETEETEEGSTASELFLLGYVIVDMETRTPSDITCRIFKTAESAEAFIEKCIRSTIKYDSEPVFISKGATK